MTEICSTVIITTAYTLLTHAQLWLHSMLMGGLLLHPAKQKDKLLVT
jgi:hypothetical protein